MATRLLSRTPPVAALATIALVAGACVAPTADDAEQGSSASTTVTARALNVQGATVSPLGLAADPSLARLVPGLAQYAEVVPQLTVVAGTSEKLLALPGGTIENSVVNSSNWSGGVLPATSGAPKAAPGSALDGMTTSGQQHVHYVGTDGHIHELYFAHAWVFNDLTTLAGAPSVAASSKITSYLSPWNSQQHLDFIGTDGHVHELMFDTAWHHTDLTQAAGGVAVAAGSRLDGYVSSWNDQQHVNYVGVNGDVHELMYDSAWHEGNLSVTTKATSQAVGPLVGFTSGWNDQQHVNFLGADGHVHELMYDSSWHHTDLTNAAGGLTAASGSALDGYVTTWNDQLHVNFVDTSDHVRELMYDSSWHSGDLTAASGAPVPASGSALDGYASPFNNQQHVNFLDSDNHVRELMYDSSWHSGDLTNASGSAPATRGSSLDGYVSTSNGNQQHVNYLDASGDVHELMYDSSWHTGDLTSSAIAPWVTAVGAWKVPSVSQPGEGPGADGGWDSSSWVGIDGTNGSNDVLQAGVQQSVDSSGKASYTPWYEWFAPTQSGQPGYVSQTNISNFTVNPGDTVVCEVQYVNLSSGRITFIDETSRSGFSIELAPPAGATFSGNTVEWIIESPTKKNQYCSLPAFTPVVFTSATGTDLHGSSNNAQNGGTDNVNLGGENLTTTSLGLDSVTIDFLPWYATNLTSAAAGPASAVSIGGYASPWNDQQHVDFVGGDLHIHELMYDGSWHSADLTAITGGVEAAPLSRVTGYVTAWNDQQHVNYVGNDFHVHELMYDSAWHTTDLTAAAGGVSAKLATGIDGYVSSWNDQQHVDYIGSDGHVHELMYDSEWHSGDLTDYAGAPAAIAGSALDGYTSAFNSQQHVDFVDVNGHVHELMYDSAWHSTDLTSAAGSSPPATTTALDGYTSSFGTNQQHVDFIGTNGHVYELMFDTAWHTNDLSADTGAPGAIAASIDGYTSSFNGNQQHVDFVGSDGHVHELMFDTAWHTNDLTSDSSSAGTASTSAGALVGFVTPWSEQQHVDFVRTDGNVEELLY